MAGVELPQTLADTADPMACLHRGKKKKNEPRHLVVSGSKYMLKKPTGIGRVQGTQELPSERAPSGRS